MRLFFSIIALFFLTFFQSQIIRSIQLFNPKTQDQTPVIGTNEQLILRFDDLTNGSQIYRYTFKHYDRNWQDDGLFFSEIATGNSNALLDDFQYSFNTLQAFTHYELKFPNEKNLLKISGNYEIIVYKNSADQPLFKRRFYVVEDNAVLEVQSSRTQDPKDTTINQRIEIKATGRNSTLTVNVNSITLNAVQNNNLNTLLTGIKPSMTLGNQLLFQNMNLVFSGNNEFYYFDNKNIKIPADMVRETNIIDGQNYTYLHPTMAHPLSYQYQPDVNGAFYFRRNDMGLEREANREADYAWVVFSLDSEKIDDNMYILGGFNDFQPSDECKMVYDESLGQYIAKIYLKQGFYNYTIGIEEPNGKINLGTVNGNFWQTENLYQAFLYYRPFGRNYDGILGYGELRNPVR